MNRILLLALTLAPLSAHAADFVLVAKGALGILRLYLPAQAEPVEIDWIELQGAGAKKRWEF